MDNLDSDIEELISQTQYLGWTDFSPLADVIATPPVLPPSLTLVGKIISLKPISKATIKKEHPSCLEFLKSVSIEAKDDNKVVFIFEDSGRAF
jgi:hypothetical protein